MLVKIKMLFEQLHDRIIDYIVSFGSLTEPLSTVEGRKKISPGYLKLDISLSWTLLLITSYLHSCHTPSLSLPPLSLFLPLSLSPSILFFIFQSNATT